MPAPAMRRCRRGTGVVSHRQTRVQAVQSSLAVRRLSRQADTRVACSCGTALSIAEYGNGHEDNGHERDRSPCRVKLRRELLLLPRQSLHQLRRVAKAQRGVPRQHDAWPRQAAQLREQRRLGAPVRRRQVLGEHGRDARAQAAAFEASPQAGTT